MTQQELDARAQERAVNERLHTFKVFGKPIYLVRSRHTEPGSYHIVYVEDDHVTACDCDGWFYRQSCTHAAAVQRRLNRERPRRLRTVEMAPAA